MRNMNMEERMSLYIAGPLFNRAERDYNAKLKQVLTPYFHVYLPQEDGGLLVEMVRSGLPADMAARQVFRVDIEAIHWCDLLLIVLDGRTVDEGAALELGYAYAKEKACYGLKTDSRQLLPFGNNPMIDGCLRDVFPNIARLIAWAKTYATHHHIDGNNIESFQPIEPELTRPH